MDRFEVTFMGPALEFLLELPIAARKKVLYNFERASERNDPELMKKLDSDIWEFRTQYQGIQYRLLAFWDKQQGRLVVATHGFVKKTDKVPGGEIQRAHKLRDRYFTEKTNRP
ncbi:MAG: type II toxin-antitoxin system RelE/ParE family toxin [Flavobacteriales bacterium]